VSCRGNFDLPEDQYFEIIADKTAALTACSCRLGAYYAGADAELCERLARFGRWLGIAFQIADDLLDVLGDEATTGKSLGTDLAKQKATLPLIRLLDRVPAADRAEILGILTRGDNHRMEALRPWYRDTDAIPYAHQKAGEYALRAARELEGLQSATAVEMLRALTEFVVARHE
jgi:octaprenyl-diphosphate synthase